MSDELVLYTNPWSRGRIARWMLEEVGASYRVELLEYGTTMKSPAYLAINPMGKVPTITHGSAVVTEAAAICAYLADAFPRANLLPPANDHSARANYYRWLFFAAGPVEQAVTNRAAKFLVSPEQERMFGYGNFAHVMDALDRKIGSTPYICGDRFTAADVYVGSSIGWGLQFGTIEKRPSFVEYFDRLKVRPAYVRGNEKDDALVSQMSKS